MHSVLTSVLFNGRSTSRKKYLRISGVSRVGQGAGATADDRGLQGESSDCFWANAPFKKVSGAAPCKHHNILHGIQGKHEVRQPLVTQFGANVVRLFQ